jgi:2-keto-4-pentenoate hydratase/2-oxohepta-3-ene-1,7-dioic acid hydratase in catechol pathway
MKLVFYDTPGAAERSHIPGVLRDDGVVNIESAVAHLPNWTPQVLMSGIISDFDSLRPELERLAASGQVLPLSSVQLRPPLPRPSKILACIGNYWEHDQREARPLNMFLKSPDAVIGPGDTVMLPNFTEAWVFHHEAELGVVIKGPAKDITAENFRDAIFGYTCVIDVSARYEGRRTWRNGSWMGKSFDTFAPIGPCIVTADEIPDPNDVVISFWNNGELYHRYNTDDMEHWVPELIAFATNIMTMNSGDVLMCGTNHEGLGPLQEGDHAEIEVAGVGKMDVHVQDPLHRSWERGVYMGEGSTNPAARASGGS